MTTHRCRWNQHNDKKRCPRDAEIVLVANESVLTRLCAMHAGQLGYLYDTSGAPWDLSWSRYNSSANHVGWTGGKPEPGEVVVNSIDKITEAVRGCE